MTATPSIRRLPLGKARQMFTGSQQSACSLFLSRLVTIVDSNAYCTWRLSSDKVEAIFFFISVYGFEIPDRFVIGFGLDYNEKFRDLNVRPWIALAKVDHFHTRIVLPECCPFRAFFVIVKCCSHGC